MQQYKYLYTKRTAAKIRSFYKNVAKKYRHTYSLEDMERNVRDAFFAIYAIEGDTIKVIDACHAQNMHE